MTDEIRRKRVEICARYLQQPGERLGFGCPHWERVGTHGVAAGWIAGRRLREGCAPAGPRHRRAQTELRIRGGTGARRGLGAVGNSRIVACCARSPARSAAEGHAQLPQCILFGSGFAGLGLGIPAKKILMAPHCVRTIRPTRRSTPDIQPETGKRSTGFADAAERRLNRGGVTGDVERLAGHAPATSTGTCCARDVVYLLRQYMWEP
jgi:hypothetical protein